MIGAIDRLEVDKVLICAKSTKQITGLLSESDFCYELKMRGYSWMTITSRTGAIINGQKVIRLSSLPIIHLRRLKLLLLM